MQTVYIIEDVGKHWASTNKKKAFKSWIDSEIQMLEEDRNAMLEIDDEMDDGELQTITINELKKYVEQFDKKTEGYQHFHNVLSILRTFDSGAFHEGGAYDHQYQERKLI